MREEGGRLNGALDSFRSRSKNNLTDRLVKQIESSSKQTKQDNKTTHQIFILVHPTLGLHLVLPQENCLRGSTNQFTLLQKVNESLQVTTG